MTDLGGYAKHYAAQYDDGSFETVMVAVRRRHVIYWLERYRARRVLEVGCGLEPLFGHYNAFDSWRTLEPVADFAGRAQDSAAGDERIRVVHGFVEDQAASLTGEEFDFVVVSGLLHEVPEPSRILQAVRSLCTGTTIVHLNVPNMQSFHRLLAVEMGLIDNVSEPSERDHRFGHRAQFDREQFDELLASAGFRVVESGTYFVKPFTHAQMDALLQTDAFPQSLIDGLDRMTKYMPAHGAELYSNARKS